MGKATTGAQPSALNAAAQRLYDRLPPTPQDHDTTKILQYAVERERQRVEILVLGGERPAPIVTYAKRRGRRRVVARTPVKLDPGVERALAIREDWSHKTHAKGPTAETLHQLTNARPGALARLRLSGAINDDQLSSAVQIAEVAQRITSDATMGIASLEGRVDGGRRGADFLERLADVRAEIAYTYWRQDLPHTRVVLDMVIGDVGLTTAAERHGMHKRKAKRLLLHALDLWPDRLQAAVKFVTRADVDAAHAVLLA